MFVIFLLVVTQPYQACKRHVETKHKTRHRGRREDVPMYREQLDRPEASALPLALQPGGGGAGSSSKNNNLVRERGATPKCTCNN